MVNSGIVKKLTMSDLLKSALGFLGNPSVVGPGGPQQAGGAGQHYGGGGQGSSDETSAIGDVIGFQGQDQQKLNVRIVKLIAEGGFSYVYRGVDTASNQLVAVKKMLAPDPEALKGIEQEVEFMRQFHHDNIIKFYGSIMRPSGRLKEYFIAMEYCQVPLPTPPLRLQHTTQVFGQTCKAMKYLHDFGIVHRDIKVVISFFKRIRKYFDWCGWTCQTSRFWFSNNEKFYPTPDWSMSKRTIIEEQIAQKTTPMYRAPEMLDLWSNHPIDEHCDMWALGCLLYALNFGQHPFQDSNKLAITNANYNFPKNVSDSNPLVCIIRGLLKVNPLERITFGQISELLQSIAECENFSINGPLPFKPAISPEVAPAGGSLGPSPAQLNAVGNGSGPHRPLPSQSSHHHHGSSGGGGGGSGLLGSIKGMGSSLLKNIKEQSQQYMYGPGVGLPGAQPGGSVASAPAPSRPPPPPPVGQDHHRPPPARPAPPSPRTQPKSSGHLEFENREYDIMQQRQQPPSRPAPPKPPPPARPVSPRPPEPVHESVGNLLDISLDSSVNNPPQTTASSSNQPQAGSNLLDDLFGSSSSSSVPPQQYNTTPSFADDLLWGNATSANTGSSSTNQSGAGEVNLLGDTADPFASLLGKSAPTTTTPPNPSFGAQPPFGGPTILQPGMGSAMPSSSSFQNLNFPKNAPMGQQPSQQNLGTGLDLFGSVGKSASSGSIPKNSSTPNLTDQILGDLMGGLGMGSGNGGAGQRPTTQPTAATANNGNKSNPSINLFGGSNGNGSKPNYNRHQIFDASPTNAPEKKPTLNDAFGDILSSQGFASSKGDNQPKTINDLRKIELLQNPNADPVQLKVNEWREGKKKNIRALLASLHTVTWEGCNWEETNMSQMITPAQVKKVYRKACLAIHPDKQMGKEWEQLAKLLFVELNEAWAAFEEQQT